MSLTESILEDAALSWFKELGYAVAHGPHIAPGEPEAERDGFGDTVLAERLRAAVARLNPGIPAEAQEDAVRKVLRVATPSLVQTNRSLHRMLRDGVEVEYPRPDGSIAGDRVRIIDFDTPAENDWLAVNQFAVVEGQCSRRADVTVFVNGIPLGLIELKNAADEDATVWSAYAQVQTYKAEIPSLLGYNAVLVVSDGVYARIGSITANQEWFKVWREIDDPPLPSPSVPLPKGEGGPATGMTYSPSTSGRGAGGEGQQAQKRTAQLELQTLLRGVFAKDRFLCLLLHFTAFEEDPDTGTVNKIIAGYHQFHAVNAAVEETLRASGMGTWGESHDAKDTEGRYWAGRMNDGAAGDRRAGVVWHTQGSGKSLSMLFYAGRIIRNRKMQNPTLVVLTDRNDLDDQLFGQFQRCHEILNQTPIQAESRAHLSELLHRSSGGVIFTTIQKFAPLEPSPQSPLPEVEGVSERSETHYRGGYDFAGHTQYARALRQETTDAEALLWELLRNQRLLGLKFRRQHQFGEYICDFYCTSAKLVIECDGNIHQAPEREAFDQHRDAYLKSQGLTVLRFTNNQVISDTESVLKQIASQLPSTSGRGAGGEGKSATAISLRRNIVVIADEAHCSQYDLIDGLARNMRDTLPFATFIGFTGTPIEKTDANTRAVFGDYISVYDIQRAVADKATVPIYYESRIAKLALNAAAVPKLDEEFEEITEGEELTRKEKLKTKWAALEALVGDPKRIALVAQDIVTHFERRWEAMDGKAMVVCMSRRICVDLYDAIIRLRPDWASAKDDDAESESGKACVVKVVMTGSADDGPLWQPHIRNKLRRRKLAVRFKDSKDSFRIVIVRDMWLTGFDAPCLHTMYLDKPMQGHGLMQAIARVNRVFRDKPGGLVVDYLGLADQLRKALSVYTESGGMGDPTYDTAKAIAVMLEKHEVACNMLHQPAPVPDSPFYVYAILCEDDSVYIGHTDNLLKRWGEHLRGSGAEWTKKHRPIRIAHYDFASSREEAVTMEKEWKTGFGRKRVKRLIENGTARQAGGFKWTKWTTGTATERLQLIPAGQEHILAQADGKQRFIQVVTELSRAFALCAASDEASEIRDDVSFFQTLQAALNKQSLGQRKTPEQMDAAVRQLVSKAIVTDGQVIDVFTAAGIAKPDISILSEQFLAEVRGLKHKNVAAELLEKLLRDELRVRSRRNLIQSQLFSERLKKALNAYHNRAISTLEFIDELIRMAKDMDAANKRGQDLGLNDDEVAFYDALATNDTAVKVMGDDKLKVIAVKLLSTVRKSVTIDWNLRESARAKIRVMVRHILREFGYPPDLQEEAVKTVLAQAELVCADWEG